jgi:hypothetical protein
MGEKTEHEEAFRLSDLADEKTHKTKQQNEKSIIVIDCLVTLQSRGGQTFFCSRAKFTSVFLQNSVQKQGTAFLKYVTGAAKNFGGRQFGHACYRARCKIKITPNHSFESSFLDHEAK